MQLMDSRSWRCTAAVVRDATPPVTWVVQRQRCVHSKSRLFTETSIQDGDHETALYHETDSLDIDAAERPVPSCYGSGPVGSCVPAAMPPSDLATAVVTALPPKPVGRPERDTDLHSRGTPLTREKTDAGRS